MLTEQWKPAYGGYDWDKHSRAIVMCNGRGHGAVLWTVGGHVRCMEEAVGYELSDLGLDDAPQGLSVWEGRTVGGSYNSSVGDYDGLDLKGAFRELTNEEWDSVRAGKCPWNDDDWLDPRVDRVVVDDPNVETTPKQKAYCQSFLDGTSRRRDKFG